MVGPPPRKAQGYLVKQKFRLSHDMAPGDIISMTGLVRDIARAYPGVYDVSVETPHRAVWANNPYLAPKGDTKSGKYIRLTYGGYIRKAAKEPVHFLTAWHRNFEDQTGLKIPVTEPKPDLHLTADEANNRLVSGRYWVVVAGGKLDFTTKHWSYARHQKVVDGLLRCGIPVVQAGSLSSGPPPNRHPVMEGAINLLGKTDLRQFMRLIAQADGVICSITSAMHIAAAFERPCVVIAGGREEAHWEAYSNGHAGFREANGKVRIEHAYLHTMGLLPCCETKGCWLNKASSKEEDRYKLYCKLPVLVDGQTIPRCLDMITEDHVLGAVMNYYQKGVLPPIGQPPQVILPAAPQPLPMLTVAAELTTSPAPPKPSAQPTPVPVSLGPAQDSNVFDHPRIGGRFTVMVLVYGEYFPMHRRCLDAILATVPANRLDLRVIANEPCPATDDYVKALGAAQKVSVYYRNPTNLKKYPAMRAALHDPAHPISTNWTIWFDDDTMCDRNPAWLQLLAKTIIEHPNDSMFGPHQIYQLTEKQPQWLRSAPWYRKRPFRDRAGRPSPEGNKVHFCTGSFWAIHTPAIRQADIPDTRLGHNGGDWTIGEQLYQAGLTLKNFSSDKSIVNWSSTPRRGLDEVHPGTTAKKR